MTKSPLNIKQLHTIFDLHEWSYETPDEDSLHTAFDGIQFRFAVNGSRLVWHSGIRLGGAASDLLLGLVNEVNGDVYGPQTHVRDDTISYSGSAILPTVPTTVLSMIIMDVVNLVVTYSETLADRFEALNGSIDEVIDSLLESPATGE